MTSLAGAHVLVTGASRGIGECLAYEVAERSGRLTLVARDHEALDRIADDIGAWTCPADLSDRAGVLDLVSRAEAHGGPVDVLINNAAFVHSGSIVCDSHERLRRSVEVNLLAPMELTRQVLGGMIERRRGHIVNVSSLAAWAVFPGLVAYSATKAGLAHFTAGLRTDLRGTAIKVTLADLGPVRTEALVTAQSYPPALASYRRAYQLRLLVDVAPERAAARIISAVERDRRAVRIPRRAAPLGQIPELPRRAVDLLLTGLDRAPRRDV